MKNRKPSSKKPKRSALKEWLSAIGIDFRRWGTGATKSFEQLLEEIQNGETQIEQSPLRRAVTLVQLLIESEVGVLVEEQQRMANKSIRRRNLPPAEKLLPGETYRDAAIRCATEELGVTQEDVQIIAGTHRRRTVTAESKSYPGLLTRFTVHTVAARIKGLPNHSFWTKERSPIGDEVISHLWTWKKTDSKF